MFLESAYSSRVARMVADSAPELQPGTGLTYRVGLMVVVHGAFPVNQSAACRLLESAGLGSLSFLRIGEIGSMVLSKRRLSWLNGLLRLHATLLLVSLAACGGESGNAAGDGESERRFVSVGTAPPGGAFFVVGGALAEVMDASGPDGWRVSAEATKGSKENIRRLVTGELDLALANSAISYFAVRGEGEWEKAFGIRTVMTLAPNVGVFLTPEGSGIERLSELAGKRVVVGPAGAGFEYFLRPVLAAHGVSYDDFTPLNATQAGAVDMLSDGSASAAFLGGAVPTASVTQATASGGMRFLPYETEPIESLLTDYAFFDRATIPSGTYNGLEADFDGLNVGSMHLIASADADEEFVYQATKTIWENRAAVVERHPAGRAINPKVAIRNTGLEFHPGAIRFFTEIGIWPVPPTESDAAESDAAGSDAAESDAAESDAE